MTLKNNPQRNLPTFLLLGVVLLLCFIGSAPAKMRMLPDSALYPGVPSRRHEGGILAFENRLPPTSKPSQGRTKYSMPSRRPNAPGGRFSGLGAVWSRLDPSFLAVYLAACPPIHRDTTHASPRAATTSFTTPPTRTPPMRWILPTPSGSADSTNWRTKTSGANGIPDYIDQVAFSCDSAWSMEVNRFGFHQPVSMNPDSAPAVPLSFFCTETGDGYYGETFADGPIPNTAIGFFAHCEIRGNWNGSIWVLRRLDLGLNYNVHPENAAHVTCVHENFHGIQFSMLWNSDTQGSFDYFPLGWIEGTAVMMEHLGFDYVKDYIQYDNRFFRARRMSFFDGE